MNSVMETLMEQYKQTWEKAKQEQKEYGSVSESTEQILVALELKMEMFQAGS